MNPLYINIKNRRLQLGMSQEELAEKMGYTSRSSIAKIEAGVNDIPQSKIEAFAKALHTTPRFLMGWEDNYINLNTPQITTDTVTFPVVGSIAAGYDEIAIENWSGETVEIPLAYLKGRKKEEYFVLSVKGDSMYPLYMDGDKVLILRQNTLNHSGEIGAVLYEGENATLKKVEYVDGEDWMRLVPVNPQYKPKEISGSDLEQCRILGIPKLLIREI